MDLPLVKRITITLFLLLFTQIAVLASDDPVRYFLDQPSGLRTLPGFYSSDKVFVLYLDLQGNGEMEALVTLNRDRDGHEGNEWVVYKWTPAGYRSIGTMTFDGGFFIWEK